MNGQAAQAGTVWLDYQQTAGFQGSGPSVQQRADSGLLRRIQFIAQTEEHDAGCASLRMKKEFGEVQILSEQRPAMFPCPIEQLNVRCGGGADGALVFRLPARSGENRQPFGAEVHVHQ